MADEKKSIFDLADKFSIESPFGRDWINEDFIQNNSLINSGTNDIKQKVQYYVNPDKEDYESQRDKADKQYKITKANYISYYKKIGKIKNNSSEEQIMSAFSPTNKKELKRLEDLKRKNQKLLDEAIIIEKQWNKLNKNIEDVVDDFNKRKKYSGNNRLNPSLLKALMFSESEMGAGSDYNKLIEFIPKNKPDAVYQLNLGRVTDANVYNSVVKEFNIPIDWRVNYKDMGNNNDVMLAAGALIKKKIYANSIKSTNFKADLPWFNAVVAYKGDSAEGSRKAKLVWDLFLDGTHPYSREKKLY